MKPEAAIKKAIANGVNQKLFAYAGKAAVGRYEPLIFEPDVGVDGADIDISDEMVLLTAAKAREHIQPPVLARVVVSPEILEIKPGEAITLSASCYDQHGHPFGDAPVTWSASGGAGINQEGRFSAQEIGDNRIDAGSGSTAGTAQIRVRKTITPPPPPPPPSLCLGWASPPRGRPTLGFGYFSGVFLDPVLGFPG